MATAHLRHRNPLIDLMSDARIPRSKIQGRGSERGESRHICPTEFGLRYNANCFNEYGGGRPIKPRPGCISFIDKLHIEAIEDGFDMTLGFSK